MEKHGGDRRADHFATTPTDGSHHHYNDGRDRLHGSQPDHRHHHNFNGEQDEPPGFELNSNPNNSLPPSGQKRQHPHLNGGEYGGFVKLYVVGITRTATEQDISTVFGEHGRIVEIVLLKDKRTGLQQGSFGPHVHKLYVGCLNRQAMKWEIEEIFSPFGLIEEVFIVRDEFKQNRGCAFVQFSCREMAIAAIHALNGTYVMRGCDQPLIVRFAAPKKPRVGDSRPAPYVNDPSNGHMLSNEMQQMKSSHSECKTSNGTAPASHSLDSITETENSIECEWSEHVSPDGDLYYYNCVTCESRWEKPEDYAVYEEELDDLEEHQQESVSEVLSSPDVTEAQRV